ncbi:hypothetical protein [Sinorhizobium sp. RAC02]|uniref:hypothetical protein n=1 Tax=Sinorhizobium sp. RAC02 TaxID=1842534 RepID=UPI0012379EF5|nr:hypothetical protein [Sinorhizobium sp. RAC02]
MDPVDSENNISDGDSAKKGSSRQELRPFPRKALADALKVVHAIKDKNAGKAYSPPQIADAIGRRPRSSEFGVILSAAQAYGLTEGNTRASTISLTDLGRRIAYPRDPQDESEGKFKAFCNVDVFYKVYQHYENNTIPEKKFFRNTLIS